MKDEKIRETLKKAQEAVQKLDDEALDSVAGAGNPYVKVARVPLQGYEPEVRPYCTIDDPLDPKKTPV